MPRTVYFDWICRYLREIMNAFCIQKCPLRNRGLVLILVVKILKCDNGTFQKTKKTLIFFINGPWCSEHNSSESSQRNIFVNKISIQDYEENFPFNQSNGIIENLSIVSIQSLNLVGVNFIWTASFTKNNWLYSWCLDYFKTYYFLWSKDLVAVHEVVFRSIEAKCYLDN